MPHTCDVTAQLAVDPTIMTPTIQTAVRVPEFFDLRRTLAPLHRGGRDPQMRAEGSAIWRACRTPAGTATVRLEPWPSAGEVRATAWGAGAPWLLDHLPALLGADDRPEEWTPRHPVLREINRQVRGVRLGRTGLVLEALVPAVLEQKVTSAEAWQSWRDLLWRYGDPAPGPMPLRLPPSPARLCAMTSWEWHGIGVEQKRALTIRSAALRAARLEEGGEMGSPVLRARLESLPGIGAWTSAEVALRALGDADAVSVGDYHLPGLVGLTLAGRRTDDDGMLKLLEPERPHRARAVRLIELGGSRPARRGPRMPARNYRRI
jgi:3-methyladenine DNA glycosylase/8-oxoguanine DNA glycosylase